MFNYTDAIEECKNGKAVRSVSWHEDRCIVFMPSGSHAWLKRDYIAEAEMLNLPLEDGSTMRAPKVATNPDTTYVIYQPSEIDKLSEWTVIE